MAEYLVELYVAQGDHSTVRLHVERAERAGVELTREGRPVAHAHSFDQDAGDGVLTDWEYRIVTANRR